VDEDAAWRQLLDLEPGTSGESGPLRFEPDGSWTCEGSVTPGAKTVLDLFGPLRTRERFVVGQLGQSLDGRIATETGHSHYINGPADLRRLHRLRAVAQAVVVGAGTVASDDPRLTVRRVEGPNPARVVLDPSGRLDPRRRLFRDDEAPTVWVRGEGGIDSPTGGLPPHVDAVRLPTSSGRFDPHAVLDMLADRGRIRVLVEGGGITVSGFLAAGALDRLHVSVAPLLIGSGRPSLTLPPIETLAEAIRPPVRHFRLGDDLLFDLELRDR